VNDQLFLIPNSCFPNEKDTKAREDCTRCATGRGSWEAPAGSGKTGLLIQPLSEAAGTGELVTGA